MWIKKDYYEDLEDIIHGVLTVEKEDLKELILSVFERIPESDRDILIYERCIQYTMPLNCTADRIFINPLVNKDERYHPLHTMWLVSFNPDILKRSRKDAIYTIAHELAHVFLEHTGWGKEYDGVPKHEIEADLQVIKWGFESELKQCEHNYLSKLSQYVSQNHQIVRKRINDMLKAN